MFKKIVNIIGSRSPSPTLSVNSLNIGSTSDDQIREEENPENTANRSGEKIDMAAMGADRPEQRAFVFPDLEDCPRVAHFVRTTCEAARTVGFKMKAPGVQFVTVRKQPAFPRVK